MPLLPHQLALVETILSPASKRVVLVHSVPGLGMTAALSAAVRQLLAKRPLSRVLFLAPRAIAPSLLDTLRLGGVPGLLVDRYRFREMLDSTNEGFWLGGGVTMMSYDFAKQNDIRDSLVSAHWELVIAVEAHSVRGRREELLQQVAGAADRVVLASGLGVELGAPFSPEEATVVEWQRDLIMHGLARPELREVLFELTPTESALAESVENIASRLHDGTELQALQASLLRNLCASSPAALERALRNLTDGVAELSGWERLAASVGDDASLDDETSSAGEVAVAELTDAARRALDELDAVSDDSKLQVFEELLARLSQEHDPARRVCVLTLYSSTLYYLVSDLEGRDVPCQFLVGAMNAEDRMRSLALFSDTTNILVSTLAVLKGVGLPQVTDLVLYDIPANDALLHLAVTRFDGPDRTAPLTVYALAPAHEPDGRVARQLAMLRAALC